MRFALPILSLALFCAAMPADAQTTRQRSSASSSANLNEMYRIHKSSWEDIEDRLGEIKISLGASYKRFETGDKSGTTPMTLSYKAKEIPVTWYVETDGYVWEKPHQRPYENGLSESRVRGDYELGNKSTTLTLGYGIGITPKGDTGDRSYAHTIHGELMTTLGNFSPSVDWTRSWTNGSTPGIWDRATELYLGADYKTSRKHTLSAGLTRQIVDGADSLSSVEARYKFPIAGGENDPLILTLKLSLGLGKDEESKSGKIVLTKQF
ncbi:MAG: hypothetical protein AB1807_15140 [Pseudomonadota bacterium]